MRAIGEFTLGGIVHPDGLPNLDIPVHRPRPHDLLVQVKAISPNPVDARAPSTSANADGWVRGWDAAGLVHAVGSKVRNFREGDRVFYASGRHRPATRSEYHLVDERIVGRKPECLDWAAAAALPLSSITAWELLFDRLRQPYGDKSRRGALLVIDGAGGVGSILIQLARRLTGLTVIATASSPGSIAWVREMGAHHVVDHRLELSAELQRIGFPEVEFVACLSGSEERLEIFPRILKAHGHLVLADDPDCFDIVALRCKSVTVSWEHAFTDLAFETQDMSRQHVILQEVADLVDAGVLRTTMTRQEAPISAETLRRVHELAEAGRSIGKVVLSGFA